MNYDPEVARKQRGHAATPLGLCAFAMTTFVMGCINLGFTTNTPSIVIGLAFFYGGFIQLVCGIWHLVCTNSFEAVLFGSWGGFWLSYAPIIMNSWGIQSDYADNNFAIASGYFNIGWVIFALLMLMGSLRAPIAILLLNIFVVCNCTVLTIGTFTGSTTWIRIGGFCGITASLLAWYNAAVGLLNNNNSFIKLSPGPSLFPARSLEEYDSKITV
ncbi:Meiotically up-regulated protein 86 protein [Basidiobolus ranarum]|uniref:Meiotically up-regulated protein 86 protein n=1 Tax=Basidiobolus ranarum TaxID=34480 RepID=A0ABR2W640_9FUNG